MPCLKARIADGSKLENVSLADGYRIRRHMYLENRSWAELAAVLDSSRDLPVHSKPSQDPYIQVHQ